MENHQFIQRLSVTLPPLTAGEVVQFEQFSQQYPWCGIAHQLLLEAYQLSGNGKAAQYTPMAAMYAISRYRLHQRLQTIKVQEFVPVPVLEPAPIPAAPKPPVAVAPTGDYFAGEEPVVSADDAVGRFLIEKPRIKPVSSALSGTVELPPVPRTKFYTLEDMVTETLAQIYAEQGLYTLAIDTYEKLSLLEPKKSVYFATLIQNLKSKSKF
jgi:hypothetical protein